MKLPVLKLKSLIKDSYLSSDGRNVYGQCPYCGFDEFGISTEDNHVFGCFRKKECGATGNIFTLLKKLGIEISLKKQIPPLDDKLEGLGSQSKEVEKEIELKQIKLPIGYRRVERDSYLENKRGLTPQDLSDYEFGVTKLDYKFEGYVIKPIYQQGKLISYVGRLTNNTPDLPKYRNSSAKTFSYTLWGIDEVKKHTSRVVLVEGLFDKIAVDKMLKRFDLYGPNICCCTFSAKITQSQNKLMIDKGVRNLVSMFESDVKASSVSRLSNIDVHYDSIEYVDLPYGEDPDSLPLKNLQNLFVNRKKLDIFTL